MREGLGESGKQIWDSLKAETLPAAARSLVLEYARCADVADRLAGLAAGKRESWAELVYDEMGEIHLEVNKILAEQRQTQATLKSLHAEIRAAGLLVAASAGEAAAAAEPETPLERRRREKLERESQLG